MSRSKWKGFHVIKAVVRPTPIKRVFARSSVIIPKFLNKKVFVYNGKDFIPLYITKEKLGFKFGEFAYTRKRVDKLAKNKIKTKKTKK